MLNRPSLMDCCNQFENGSPIMNSLSYHMKSFFWLATIDEYDWILIYFDEIIVKNEHGKKQLNIRLNFRHPSEMFFISESFEMSVIWWIWKIGGISVKEMIKIMRIPIILTTIPAFISSTVRILPLMKIIAFGGVAIQNFHCVRKIIRPSNLPMGSMNDSETDIHEGKMSNAGWIFAVLACIDANIKHKKDT